MNPLKLIPWSCFISAYFLFKLKVFVCEDECVHTERTGSGVWEVNVPDSTLNLLDLAAAGAVIWPSSLFSGSRPTCRGRNTAHRINIWLDGSVLTSPSSAADCTAKLTQQTRRTKIFEFWARAKKTPKHPAQCNNISLFQTHQHLSIFLI